jgi:teichuronic acid biosynthesis glycosyltransferase TuaC
VKILVLASDYPYAEYTAAAIYAEKCVRVMRENSEAVEVLVPRPMCPPIVSRFNPRWRNYASIPRHEVRDGIPVYRPGYPQISRFFPAFWLDPCVYLWCRGQAQKMHRRTRFDAIVSIGLFSGGLTRRLRADLGIPAAGWAIGNDVHSLPSAAHRRLVSRTLHSLDVVFYQSHYLRNCAAGLIGLSADQLPKDKHVVLPHGIPDPPVFSLSETRARIRESWQIDPGQSLVLYIGRMVRGKGIFDLLDAFAIAASQNSGLKCVLVGSVHGFDDTSELQEKLNLDSFLKERVRILPSCDPGEVWELLSAADIYVFPSYREGMPNSLLEAMAMGIASISYDIPPLVELEGGSGGLNLVPTGNKEQLAEAILRLSVQTDERVRLCASGKKRVLDGYMVRKNVPEALRIIETIIGRNEKAIDQQRWRAK